MPALASALSEKYFGVAKLAKSFGHSKLPKVLATFATDGIPKSLFDDALVRRPHQVICDQGVVSRLVSVAVGEVA